MITGNRSVSRSDPSWPAIVTDESGKARAKRPTASMRIELIRIERNGGIHPELRVPTVTELRPIARRCYVRRIRLPRDRRRSRPQDTTYARRSRRAQRTGSLRGRTRGRSGSTRLCRRERIPARKLVLRQEVGPAQRFGAGTAGRRARGPRGLGMATRRKVTAPGRSNQAVLRDRHDLLCLGR